MKVDDNTGKMSMNDNDSLQVSDSNKLSNNSLNNLLELDSDDSNSGRFKAMDDDKEKK